MGTESYAGAAGRTSPAGQATPPLDHAAPPSAPASSAPASPDDLAPVIAQAGDENFPVAARILPKRRRDDLLALYAFARLVDDIGDEGDATAEQRIAALNQLEAELDLIDAGREHELRSRVMRNLREPIRNHAIPTEPFRRLIEANRRDQLISRYENFAALRDYCVYSADPVGRVVLYLFDSATPERIAWSDGVCTALQVFEHCQDVGEDYANGRIYLPADDLETAGVEEDELAAPHTSEALREVIGLQVERARELLVPGRDLVRSLHGFAKLAVGGYVAGGYATADALDAAGYDVLTAVPKPGKGRTARNVIRLLTGRAPLAATPATATGNGRVR